jgi:BlaR1 peptidase M56
VVLARSPRVSVPVALGWLRPTIVLPDSLTGPSSAGSIDAVLLHELAHVRRGDYAWNVILRVVQAAYWPHVLVWVLGRAIAEVRERVCDELCVYEMGSPAAYRDALLSVARGIVRRPSPALGLAMARTSKLARRLARIERSDGDRRFRTGLPATFVIGTMAIAAAGAIGAAQLVGAQHREKTSGDPPKVAGPARFATNAGRVFHLQVKMKPGGRSRERPSTSGVTITSAKTRTSCSMTSAPSAVPMASGRPPALPKRPGNSSASESSTPTF